MPERMCIVTREVKDEADLLRFVRSPEGEVVPDLARKLPGRGVWVSLTRDKVADAAAKGLFARGFKAPCKAAPELADGVGKLLRGQVTSHLSLARKAGEALSGFTKVEEALRRGPVRLLLHAAGSAGDGGKLDRLAGPRTVICGFLTPDDLDLAFGRTNVIHAALLAGPASANTLRRAQALADFVGEDKGVGGIGPAETSDESARP